MWLRFLDIVRCPLCKGALGLEAFDRQTAAISDEHRVAALKRGLMDARFDQRVEAGLLTCSACEAMYPILDGLPVLLAYRTPLHDEFLRRNAGVSERGGQFRFPNVEPPSGERAVMSSFSNEWLAYDYDGVIWEMDYADHEARFLSEMGESIKQPDVSAFLEVGCGLGITTYLAHKNSGADAVGLDLSLAVWKAARHYRDNPFMHFVEASVFAVPFAPETFDLIYSRGVLHHTASTEKAFRAMAPLCRRGGTVYLWVYGMGSIRETLFRRVVYGLEALLRPQLSRAPDSAFTKAFLTAMGAGYVLFNGWRRSRNSSIQPLTLQRGIHAARDRFTPQYAHRHEATEVTGWFRQAGFDRTEILDWRIMPPADHDDYRRNVGVRGTLRNGAHA